MSSSNGNNPENNTSNSSVPTTPPASPPTDKNNKGEKARRSFRNLLWVIIVLLIGAIVGIISFLLIAPHLVFRGEAFPFFGGPMNIRALFTFIAEHIILSTVSIALLVSLVVVYARIYRQTKANFALGIFIVLLALLLDAIFTYPILQLFTSGIPTTELYYSLPTLGDVLTIVAYSVFLYLSLQ
jgi:hypothetical protein